MNPGESDPPPSASDTTVRQPGQGDRVAVDVATDGVRVPLSRRRVAWLTREVLRSEGVADALVSVTFLGADEIARLNEEHLAHEGPTDIISFALDRPVDGAPVIGDIYICPAVVREQARDHRRPVREEFTRVVVHGALHILGYEHPEGEERTNSPMWLLQERLVSRLLPLPDE